MKIAAISDVHVKFPNDEAQALLLSFLKHEKTLEAEYVFLLGDIFDLMVGPHDIYLKLFPEIFDAIDELVKLQKKIYFVEGNHDVHLEKLFKKRWQKNEVVITQCPVTKSIDGKSYYFSHGDEHEIDNHAYHRYMGFIRSKPLKIVADYLMPYAVIDYIGKKASQNSRKKGSRKFDVEGVREKFRQGVQTKTEGQFDFVLGGHSHVKDQFQFPEGKTLYLNNGYALLSKTFIFIQDHRVEFIPLS